MKNNSEKLSETIESQKQTIDKLLKKHAALQELNNELVEALEKVDFALSRLDENKFAGCRLVMRSAIAKAKGKHNEHEPPQSFYDAIKKEEGYSE